MNKLIPFHKNIEFKTSIGEITSIALDKEININKNNTISGTFTISGSYKMLKTSTTKEEFSYDIPIDITMDEKYNLENAKADIDDFKYEVVDNSLDVSIDLLIENMEEKVEVIDEVIRKEEELDIPFLKMKEADKKETKEEKVNLNQEKEITEVRKINPDEEKAAREEKTNEKEKKEDKKVESLFTKFSDDDDTYATYKVYIVREKDTLESIIEKYKISKEELENYNDLSDISINDKIVIPCINEKD